MIETLRKVWKIQRKPRAIFAPVKEEREPMPTKNESTLRRVTASARADQSITPTAYPLVFVSADGRSMHTLFLISDRARQALYSACMVKVLAGKLRYHVIAK